MSLLGLQLRRDRLSTLALSAAALAALVTSANTAREIRRVEREKLGAFDDVLDAMRPGTRVAMVNFERASRRTHFWPYIFAGAYHRARGGGVASYSFSELPHWPLHYARGQAPPNHGPFWAFRPCAYRYAEDGAYYDYVLAQGDVELFDGRRGTRGPLFVPVARAGTFVLYEKADGPPPAGANPDTVDHGPCRSRGIASPELSPPPTPPAL
jgi:hypothetical protein